MVFFALQKVFYKNLTILQSYNPQFYNMNIRHFILLCVFTFVSVAQVVACSCRPPLPMTDVEFFNADLVFIGKITHVNADEEAYRRTATFEIINPLKAIEDMAEVDIITAYQSATCGLSFKEGDLWYIWASDEGENFSSSICTRSLRLQEDGTSSAGRFQEDMLAIENFKSQTGKQIVETNMGTAKGKVRNGFKTGCWKYYNAEGILEKKCKYRKGVQVKCKEVE